MELSGDQSSHACTTPLQRDLRQSRQAIPPPVECGWVLVWWWWEDGGAAAGSSAAAPPAGYALGSTTRPTNRMVPVSTSRMKRMKG